MQAYDLRILPDFPGSFGNLKQIHPAHNYQRYDSSQMMLWNPHSTFGILPHRIDDQRRVETYFIEC